MVTEQAYPLPTGVWRNQLGSMLELWVDLESPLSGTIESTVGGVEGQYPVSGFFVRQPYDRDGCPDQDREARAAPGAEGLVA
ncbi:MAG TPA: hypothetical protein VKX24_12535 [Acidimicrobiia bacterium]|nr:hypothetical protein [Acidimicrobiia bacterium]